MTKRDFSVGFEGSTRFHAEAEGFVLSHPRPGTCLSMIIASAAPRLDAPWHAIFRDAQYLWKILQQSELINRSSADGFGLAYVIDKWQ